MNGRGPQSSGDPIHMSSGCMPRWAKRLLSVAGQAQRNPCMQSLQRFMEKASHRRRPSPVGSRPPSNPRPPPEGVLKPGNLGPLRPHPANRQQNQNDARSEASPGEIRGMSRRKNPKPACKHPRHSAGRRATKLERRRRSAEPRVRNPVDWRQPRRQRGRLSQPSRLSPAPGPPPRLLAGKNPSAYQINIPPSQTRKSAR